MNWNEHFAPGLHDTVNGQRAWLSGHFFYNNDLTSLLLDGLLPWASTLLGKGVAEQFFFIRYAENGPHLRLRLLGVPNRLVSEAVPYLEEKAAAYFVQNPSVSRKDAPPDWQPNDSVVWITYEPEIERYGGPVAIRLAEQHFQASSEAVGGAIAQVAWTYSRSLGVALQLHAAYSRYLLDTAVERADFWNTLAANWSAHMLSAQGRDAPIDQSVVLGLYEKFEQLFTRQKALLEPFFDNLWAMLATQPDFSETWYTAWLAHLRQHRYDLDALAQARQLIVPYPTNSLASDGRQYLLHSYIHMTNNRLGISTYDEGYLGYLMQRLLSGR